MDLRIVKCVASTLMVVGAMIVFVGCAGKMTREEAINIRTRMIEDNLLETVNNYVPHKGSHVRLKGQVYKVKVFDVEEGSFVVYSRKLPVRAFNSGTPARIPTDAIEYALIEFAGLNDDYKHLRRIASATQQAILQYGRVGCIMIVDAKWNPWKASMHFDNNHKHLVTNVHLLGDTKTYAVDLSKVDTSIK